MAYLDPSDPRAAPAVRIIAPDGAYLHQSRNLRGLLDHARRDTPVSVTITPDPAPYTGATARIVFRSGAYCRVSFASSAVCRLFFDTRKQRAPAWRECTLTTG